MWFKERSIDFISRRHGLTGMLWLVLITLSAPIAEAFTLRIKAPQDQGWVRLEASGQTGMVYTIQASTNLLQWTPIATTHEGIVDYPEAASPLFPHRFYRVVSTKMTSADDGKNQIRFPNDLFQSAPGNVSGPDFRWVKFAIPLQDPYRVYYQDSQKYDFHYDFATQRLEAFRGLTPAQFDQIALYTNQQQILLGTILVPPFPNETEYGIQFVGADVYPPEYIARYFELVKATVAAGAHVSAFYVPVYEQARAAETNRSFFESKGIRLASAERWISRNDIYAHGWAIGRLKYFPGTEINTAFADGRLLPQDILLTDGVPAEIPVLAGVLTLTPSTPNSHVAILAKSFGLPFAYHSEPSQREWVQQLVGKDILLRLEPGFFRIKITPLEDTIDPVLRQEILNLKSPPVLNIVAKAKYGSISAPTDPLTPADIKYFGGKASNFGFLRRAIPERSHDAIAFSFDLWDEFLDQTLPSGRTLRAEIQERLARHSYPPNIAELKRDLTDLRALITGTARFTEAQKQAIIQALSGFDQMRNIRFRSSTNVEDSEQFTGAGLYDSYSGCLRDDLDNDDQGPSHCDPTEKNERGVFRAIQKVYASFYNDNATIERLRHKVDENTVGMAILVHYSTPDDTELANGVATLDVTRGSGDADSINGAVVTQKGAVSVTNPDGNAKPEVVQGYHHPFGVGGFLNQRSSLVPLGAYVMNWDADYIELMNLFAKVADAYYGYFPHKKQFTLDFEYKKVVEGVLDVKQVREVPKILSTNIQPAYLVHETNSYGILQGEAADIFSNHRLKSFWSFHARNMKLDKANLEHSLFTRLEAEYLEGKQPNRLAGAPASLPNASHAVEGERVVDRWTMGTGAEQRDFALWTQIHREVLPPQAPVFSLSDLRLELWVNYATPQPALQFDFNGPKPVLVTNHMVVLEPRRVLTSMNYLQQRTASAGGITIHTSFYWPAPPSKGIGDKTAPLAQWKETRIEGVTTQPIVLRGEYSQTYRPGHHNFSEEFIFEPALEEGLPGTVLEELQAANVQLIYLFYDFSRNPMMILGVDGQFREAK